jgi:hypothetical protein
MNQGGAAGGDKAALAAMEERRKIFEKATQRKLTPGTAVIVDTETAKSK